MATRSILLLAFACTFLVGCNEHPYARQARELETADVAREVDEALRSGDMRFAGAMGFGLMVPGVPNYHAQYAKTHGVRVIENTSDIVEDGAHRKLQEAARQYALRYNTELLRRLQSE